MTAINFVSSFLGLDKDQKYTYKVVALSVLTFSEK